MIPYTPALNRHYNGHIKALFSHGGSSVTQEAGAMVQGQKWDGCVIRTLCCGDMCTEQRGYIYELAYSIHPQRIAGHISHRRMKVTALPNSPSSTPTQRKYFAYICLLTVKGAST